MRIGVSPHLIAVGRGHLLRVGYRWSKNGHERKFGAEIAPPQSGPQPWPINAVHHLPAEAGEAPCSRSGTCGCYAASWLMQPPVVHFRPEEVTG